MGRKLAKSVAVRNESGETSVLLKGTEPTAEQAEEITNPAAWAPESAEDRHDGGAWPPDGGLDSLDDEEVFALANSTSVSEGGEEPKTAKNTGDFDASARYQGMTVPSLRAAAVERDLDASGLRTKQEIIDLLEQDDADNS